MVANSLCWIFDISAVVPCIALKTQRRKRRRRKKKIFVCKYLFQVGVCDIVYIHNRLLTLEIISYSWITSDNLLHWIHLLGNTWSHDCCLIYTNRSVWFGEFYSNLENRKFPFHVNLNLSMNWNTYGSYPGHWSNIHVIMVIYSVFNVTVYIYWTVSMFHISIVDMITSLLFG